jgi:hypothetical protein
MFPNSGDFNADLAALDTTANGGNRACASEWKNITISMRISPQGRT